MDLDSGVNKKPVVLIGESRSGSSFVYDWVFRYNKENFGYHRLQDVHGNDEFLNIVCNKFNIGSKYYHFKNLKSKIKFIRTNQKNNLHFSYKIMLHQLPVGNEWFHDLYSYTHVIYLSRKNNWQQFVSWVIQTYNNWDHKRFYTNNIKVDFESVDIWLELKKRYDEFTDYNEKWYYEDINENFLSNYFGIKHRYMFTRGAMSHRRRNYQNNIINYVELYEYFKEKEKNGNRMPI